MSKNKTGFSLLEIMVVVVVIAILAMLSLAFFNNLRLKANDTKRKAELSQIGKFLTTSCYLPEAGEGTYDLLYVINELASKDARYQALNVGFWRDPKSGTENQSNYFYLVTASKDCSLYANLENQGEPITLPTINVPTPHGGNGVFASTTPGINGSDKYFQVSN